MKLWLLRPKENLAPSDDPWRPRYDKSFGFIIRAPDKKTARQMAHESAGDENRGEFLDKKIANTTKPWLDSKYSKCAVLTPEGDQEVIMQDL